MVRLDKESMRKKMYNGINTLQTMELQATDGQFKQLVVVCFKLKYNACTAIQMFAGLFEG